MNKDLIEKLKKNEMPFGLLTKEEQKCLKEVGKEYCQYFDGSKWNSRGGTLFILDATYRIKPDYQPEPEYIDIEITEEDGWLGIDCKRLYKQELQYPFLHLHCVPSMPNFANFWRGNDKEIYVHFQDISQLINQGRTVYARFRK